MKRQLNRLEDFDDVMDEITADPNVNWEDIPDKVEEVFSQHDFVEFDDEMFGDEEIWQDMKMASALVINLPSHVFAMHNS